MEIQISGYKIGNVFFEERDNSRGKKIHYITFFLGKMGTDKNIPLNECFGRSRDELLTQVIR